MYKDYVLLVTSLFVPLSLGAFIPFNLVYRQTLPHATELPDNWSYKGCFVDRIGGRALNGSLITSDHMSGAACVSWCVGLGFNVAGTEWGDEVRLSLHFGLLPDSSI